MIYSKRQYGTSIDELEKLKGALSKTEAGPPGKDRVGNIEIEGLKHVITRLEADISFYDLLSSGQVTLRSFSLESLPSVLVQARIAAGMSQADLAAALAIKPHLVKQYEDTGYRGVPLARVTEICGILNVDASICFERGAGLHSAVYCWNSLDELIWQSLPVEEMARRRWFPLPQGADPVECARAYFMQAAGAGFATADHRKKLCTASLPDEYGLLAWQARILDLAKPIASSGQVADFSMSSSWLPDLVALIPQADGPQRASGILADNGIIHVMEDYMPGAGLDGATMLADSGHPVIGMTLRHDRLDNFWFTLFHQLGHVFLHLFRGLHFDFVDGEGGACRDPIEIQANQFAMAHLLPETLWADCQSRLSPTPEVVLQDAETLGIDAAIIAGRIRKERNNFRILSDLVGNGRVRALFDAR